jgi:alkanesulfonate monooxygenase SsuD/methylene tetrahydromethanopterin reductase-like flavin-dependent oxidoreductase (luciferase family)
LALFKEYKDQPDDEVTLDHVCNRLIIWGTPDKVADDLLAFREEVGQFGVLLCAGKDWADPALARRSMRLLAEEVQPRVNSAEALSRTAAQ